MQTFQHKLQEFVPGMIWLDNENRVMALNGVATDLLGAAAKHAIGMDIIKFHPEKSRKKLAWLLDEASSGIQSPPMTMMINITERVLLIKVSRMHNLDDSVGTCMIFYDLTDMTTSDASLEDSVKNRRLLKLPVLKKNKVMLVNLDEVVHLKADGHYTKVFTQSDNYLCNLSLADLESRLDASRFVKVHRSHVINIHYAQSFEKVVDQCSIIMDTNDKLAIPVSRSKVKVIKDLLGLI